MSQPPTPNGQKAPLNDNFPEIYLLKQQIAASLEIAFSQQGFAEPSVSLLRVACNVSLRTLYKHYPSKETMIVAALNFRHQRYITFLSTDLPEKGLAAVSHIFMQLEQWMIQFAPNGCMSMNALTAFPNNTLIRNAVSEHKRQVRDFLALHSLREDLANAIFILHEGVSSAWPLMGESVLNAAQESLLTLLRESQK